jgi:chemotaxis protein MotA
MENQKPVKKQKIVISSLRNHNIITINGKYDYLGIIKHLVAFSDKARKEGILALENTNEMTKNKLMKRGIALAVDGTEPSLIREILQTDVNENKRRAELSIMFCSAFSNFVFATGILTTLLTIILFNKFEYFMLLYATIGLFTKYIVFEIIVWLNEIKMQKYMKMCRIIISGVMSIQEGDNPRFVEQKLLMFLPEPERENYFKEYKK